MAGTNVGSASITIEADADTSKFEAATVKAAESAGSKSGKGFATSMNKEIDKGTKDTGKSLEQNLKDVSTKGLSPLLTLAGSLGPAFAPVLGSLTLATLSLGTALAGAGSALGVFGAVFKDSFKDVKDNITQQDKFTKSIAMYKAEAKDAAAGSREQKTALDNQANSQDKLNQLMAGMTGPEKAAFEGFNNLRGSWSAFKDLNQGQTLGIMTDGFNLLSKSVPQLQPLFDIGAKAVRGLLDAAARWVDSGGLKDLITFMAGQATSTLPKLGAILVNLAHTFGSLFNATSVQGPALLDWLAKLSGQAAAFGASGGFATWVTNVQANTPGLVTTLSSLAGSLGHIAEAVTPLTPLSVALAAALGAIVNAIPVPVLTALVGGFLAFSIATKGLSAYFLIASAATKIWAASQWLLNAALDANPIGLIIVGLVALGAALVLAYNNSDTFRAIVNAAWSEVQSVVGSVVNWFTGTALPAIQGVWSAITGAVSATVGWITGTAVPAIQGAWSAIVGGVQAVGSVIASVWSGITGVFNSVVGYVVSTFGPTFNTLWAIIKFAFEAEAIIILTFWAIAKATFQLIVSALLAMGQAFTAFWQAYVAPAMTGIGNAINTVWTAIMTPVFAAIRAAVAAVGAAFTAVWTGVIAPAMTGIGNAISAVWTSIINPAFSAIKSGAAAVGAAFTAFWKNDVVPTWNGVGSAISAVWTGPISTAFSAIKTGVSAVKDAFQTAVGGVQTAWNRLDDIAKAPVKFVIDTVLNKGLITAFNWLGSKVGGPHIDNIPLPFAAGGVLPGYTPGRDVHRFYSANGASIALSGGEAIMRPEFTRAMGGKKGIAQLNKQAKLGKIGDFAAGGVVPATHAYGLGGVVDWIKGQATGALDWMGDTASSIFQSLSNPLDYLKSKMPSVPGTGVVTDLAQGAATSLLGSTVSKATAMFDDFKKAFATVGGGPQFSAEKAWILGHLGIPYLWGGTGPRYDCSGFTQAANAAAGIGIPRTAAQQQAFVKPVAGTSIKPGTLGFIGTPAEHVELYMGNGQWAEAPHTGDVTKIISQSLGGFSGGFGNTFANGGIFNAGTFDSGGTLATGLNLVRNNTGSAESLLPAGAAGTTINVTVSVDDLAKMSTVNDFIDMLRNSRATARKTSRSGSVNA